jgi:phenylacetate-CoA ligase
MPALSELVAEYIFGLDIPVATAVRAGTRAAPALADRLAAAGVDPLRLRGCADLDRVPVLTKDDLVAAQHAVPPFGGWVSAGATVRRLFCSPGPLYGPQLAGADPWRWSEALRAAHISANDRVLNCFSYHLSPAGAMFDEAAAALGAVTIPAGVGNLDLQVRTTVDLGATAFVGLPSYLHALIERALAAGLRWPISRALVTAEPLPDALRDELLRHVPVLRMAYGTAEAGLLGYETATDSGLRIPAGVLVQVCDVHTGLPLDNGKVGQIVVTMLRPEYPLIRFGTGDLSAWRIGPNGDLRLAGVLGRLGESVKVRGMFLHPRQAADVIAAVEGVEDYRFVIGRLDHVDTLRCDVVAADGADATKMSEELRDQIRDRLRLSAEVSLVMTLSEGPKIVDERGGGPVEPAPTAPDAG